MSTDASAPKREPVDVAALREVWRNRTASLVEGSGRTYTLMARAALPACLDEIEDLRAANNRLHEAITIATRTIARNSTPKQKQWSLNKIKELAALEQPAAQSSERGAE